MGRSGRDETDPAATIGAVVIGRNEGERLSRCLESLEGCRVPVVYVDSASTDGSVELARARGVEVVELDSSEPLSAARARNCGLRRLRELQPETEFAQFVDGDCELLEGWLSRAVEALTEESRLAAVCGQLSEKFPEASLYNRLCDIEWKRPPGDVAYCGGIFMGRVEALEAVGGFEETLVAGEEPELCQRLRREGWGIRCLAEPMARHDAAMLRFSQWWKRQVRTGYSALDVARRFGRGPDRLYVKSVRSARLWGIVWPVSVALAATAGGLAAGAQASIALGAAAALVLPAQALRIARRTRSQGFPAGFAWIHAWLTLAGKWAQLAGQWQYSRALASGQRDLIEYKKADAREGADG